MSDIIIKAKAKKPVTETKAAVAQLYTNIGKLSGKKNAIFTV